jgi:hypothetical protein
MMHKIENKEPVGVSFENIDDANHLRNFLKDHSDYLRDKISELPSRGKATEHGWFFGFLRDIYPANPYPLVIIWDMEEDLVEEIDGIEIHSCRAKLLEDIEEAKKPFRFSTDTTGNTQMEELMEFFDSLDAEEFRMGLPVLELTESLQMEEGPTDIESVKSSLKENSDIHATEFVEKGPSLEVDLDEEWDEQEGDRIGEAHYHPLETDTGEIPAKEYRIL